MKNLSFGDNDAAWCWEWMPGLGCRVDCIEILLECNLIFGWSTTRGEKEG